MDIGTTLQIAMSLQKNGSQKIRYGREFNNDNYYLYANIKILRFVALELLEKNIIIQGRLFKFLDYVSLNFCSVYSSFTKSNFQGYLRLESFDEANLMFVVFSFPVFWGYTMDFFFGHN